MRHQSLQNISFATAMSWIWFYSYCLLNNASYGELIFETKPINVKTSIQLAHLQNLQLSLLQFAFFSIFIRDFTMFFYIIIRLSLNLHLFLVLYRLDGDCTRSWKGESGEVNQMMYPGQLGKFKSSPVRSWWDQWPRVAV